MARIIDTGVDVETTLEDDNSYGHEKTETVTQATPHQKRHTINSLERYIRLPTIVFFGVVLLASWESFAVTFQFALLNGGPASMLYGSILAGIGVITIGLSLAELASIDPTVGAQYRWSANLAPAAPRFWGLMQGWMTVSAWCFACAGPTSSLSLLITSLVTFNQETYVPERWHTSLIMIATMIIPLLCNLWFRKVLNILETFGGILHICLFVVFIAVLAAMGSKSDTDFVFRTLTHDVSGWSDPGVAWCLGLLSATFSLSGVDSVLHMSDEVKDVWTHIPYSIIWACVTNSVMLFIFVVVLLFFIGPLNNVTTAPLPLIYVLYDATNSKPATNVLVIFISIIYFCAMFNIFASVSRLIWAFANDHGLPFSGFFAYVHPTLQVPTNALMLVGAIVVLLSLIYIGSATAFNAIISLQTLGLYTSYFFPILFILLRKLRGAAAEPPYGPFRMARRSGMFVNAFALCYLAFIITWMPFPSVLPVDKDNMNYAGPIFGGMVLLALADWCINGRKRFRMPVKRYG
ncbi:amino acid/polyamine transporter I [Truncatella angustata]|uniref:Amino acid/polyamine transporter I n=1 Tax=Truncatella angustata TaxID=152316 RepID=A0A9P8URB2_9PEZI|nr:amino acid/polyamine transporter I [Truncatella angustata]KAH6656610.1 amino acid/polyamine transporter I [Truncatella angustata]